mmetsp:Transcript_29128/g.84672  ORF Transcript_29128/g.84672 Transcript_29128/m.84672 type:complete len:418 (+) Transcript_29128:76-1329(+)
MSSKPLRRRRLGAGSVATGTSNFGGGGGNPNEPQESPYDHHEAAAAEHDHSATSTCIVGPSLVPSSPGPLHHSHHHGLAMGEEDAKVHDGPGMSFGATLRRTLTASVHSLRSTSVSAYGDESHEARTTRHCHHHHDHRAGLTILDEAIERRDWRVVLSVVNSPAGPSLSARTSHAPLFYGGRYGTTLLPLHRACMHGAPAYVIEALLRANPKAARTAESAFHRLPIHLACRSGSAQVDTIRLLLVISERDGTSSSKCRDKLKRIPLHYILANGAHPTIVDDLLWKSQPPSCLALADSEGWLALHVACGSGVDLGIVERLARAHPAATSSLTRWGSRPLDCARMFVGDRYADRVDEIFCHTLNRPLEADDVEPRPTTRTVEAPLGVIHEDNIGTEGSWDVNHASPIISSGRTTSRFAL